MPYYVLGAVAGLPTTSLTVDTVATWLPKLDNVANTKCSGNPNGLMAAGAIPQWCMNTIDKSLWICLQSDLTGVPSGSVWTQVIFSNSLASTSTPGLVQLATNAEVLAQTDTTKAVTSAGIASVYWNPSQVNSAISTAITVALGGLSTPVIAASNNTVPLRDGGGILYANPGTSTTSVVVTSQLNSTNTDITNLAGIVGTPTATPTAGEIALYGSGGILNTNPGTVGGNAVEYLQWLESLTTLTPAPQNADFSSSVFPSIYTVDTSSGVINCTLITAVDITGLPQVFYNAGNHDLILTTVLSQLITGSSSPLTVHPGDVVRLESDGTQYVAFDAGVVGGGGTITSVGMVGDNVIYNSSIGGSPITSGSGTLAPTLKTFAANTALMGPVSGSATPTVRAIVSSDIQSAMNVPGTNGLVFTSDNSSNGVSGVTWCNAVFAPPGGRLSTFPGSAGFTNQGASNYLAYWPYTSAQVPIYDTTSGYVKNFSIGTGLLLPLGGVPIGLYSVYVYSNSGSPTLFLEGYNSFGVYASWQNGILARKTNATFYPDYTYLGLCFVHATGTTNDDYTGRGIANYYNRVSRSTIVRPTSNTNWLVPATATQGSPRSFGASTTIRVPVIADPISAMPIQKVTVYAMAKNTTTADTVGIGFNYDTYSSIAPTSLYNGQGYNFNMGSCWPYGAAAVTTDIKPIVREWHEVDVVVSGSYGGLVYFWPMEFTDGTHTATMYSGAQSNIFDDLSSAGIIVEHLV